MEETFYIVPASGKAHWWIFGIIGVAMIVMLIVPVVLGTAMRAMRNAHFDVTPAGLSLHGEWMYRRKIPAEKLRGEAARIVDLRREDALRPQRRTMGTGLPGYGAGWFRLQSGDRALIYLTTRDRVVYVPTTEDYVVLLSVTEPERMVAALKRIAPRP